MFKVKYHLDGSIVRYKGRLVTQGFLQVYGIDYTETFVPTIKQELLKIILIIAITLGIIVPLMHVIGTYLKSFHRQNKRHLIYIKILHGYRSD